ncbi:MAG: ArsR/SmtB family transcription factor [Pleomorphochaeta sp.]
MNCLNDFLKLAANEDRFRMIVLLFQEKLCVCQLTEILNLSQPTVSKNLAKFRDTKCVDSYQSGKYIYYGLKANDISVNSFLESILQNIDNYPRLKEDSIRLAKKDTFITVCNSEYNK